MQDNDLREINILLIIKTIMHTYKLNRGLDSGLPYTDGKGVISAETLIRLTYSNLTYAKKYILKKKQFRISNLVLCIVYA